MAAFSFSLSPSHPPSLLLSQDWQEVWLKDCFWHFLFCFILIVIMIIWRPSTNGNRFAYSLVNDLEQEDEEEEEEIENKNFGEGVVCLLHCLFTCFYVVYDTCLLFINMCLCCSLHLFTPVFFVYFHCLFVYSETVKMRTVSRTDTTPPPVSSQAVSTIISHSCCYF